jgi:hypothetical protein
MKYLFVLWLVACLMQGCSDPESQFVGTWEYDWEATDKINLPESESRNFNPLHGKVYLRIFNADGTFQYGYVGEPDSLGYNLSGTWKITPYKPQYSDPNDYRDYLESRSEFQQKFMHPNMVSGYIGIDHVHERIRPYLNLEKLPQYVLEYKPDSSRLNYRDPVLYIDSEQMKFQAMDKIIIFRKVK